MHFSLFTVFYWFPMLRIMFLLNGKRDNPCFSSKFAIQAVEESNAQNQKFFGEFSLKVIEFL